METEDSVDKKKFPFEIKELKREIQEKISSDFKGLRSGFVQVGPEQWLLPKKIINHAEDFYNFEARSDDVFVCSYPRSGTTWLKEMVWLICNNLDYESAMGRLLNERFPFLE